jgi:hypothetical protein
LSDSLYVCLPAFRLPVSDLHSPSVKGRWKEDDDTADITAAAVSSQDHTVLIRYVIIQLYVPLPTRPSIVPRVPLLPVHQ